MIPNVEHLAALRNDLPAFEAERNRIISEYIKSLPEDKRKRAYAYQLKVDLARLTMSDEELLSWMCAEAVEMTANLGDLFSFIEHKATDVQKTLGS